MNTKSFKSEITDLPCGRMVEASGTITPNSISYEYWGKKGTYYEGEDIEVTSVTDIETGQEITDQLSSEEIEYLEENVTIADTWKEDLDEMFEDFGKYFS